MLPCPFAMHKDVSVLNYRACLDCQPSGAGMLLGLAKSALTDPLACPQCRCPIDYGNWMLHAWGPMLEGFLASRERGSEAVGSTDPSKGPPHDSMGNALHCLPALIGAVASC